ncbi:MAG: bifunctional YncE family protein/alkaline phosphatase family protein [Myxococcota bacterium]|nr:bifunctional YncE family protein/alkaline phosphatase family protein [Myxococcota bacterium]
MRRAIAIGVVWGALAAACGDETMADVDGGADAGPVASCSASAEDFPDPVTGHCRALVREGAALPAGADGADAFVVPGGERLLRVGRVLPLGGFPMRSIAVPGTRFVVVTDGGLRDEVLAVLDVDAMSVVSQVEFLRERDEALFFGLAISSDGRRLWASGGGSDVVLAYDLDPATGALTAAPARTIRITPAGARAYVSGLALAPDGTLAVALMAEQAIALFDSDDGTELARIPLENASFPYDLVISPDGVTAFASLWGGASVVAIDLVARSVSGTIAVAKNPMGMAISPDGTTLAVACSDSDVVAMVDVATRTVSDRFFVVGEDASRGAGPGSVRFGADGRLYVTDAFENAIDVLVRSGATWSRIGRIPTLWHPTDALPLDDGTIVFLNGRHLGTGANTSPGTDDITELLAGSVSVLDPGGADDAQLVMWADAIAANNARMASLVDVECDEGAAYDFPIPRPGEGPSSQIRHIVVIVRENKTYDAYLGNLTDASGAPHGDGDPTLTLIPADEIGEVLPNTQALALEFALGDNYYSHAEQSIQGHIWSVMGRTTEFVERSWLTTWGRGYWSVPPGGTAEPIGYPEEGSGFDFLRANDVTVHNMGEIIGSRAAPLDPRYPGLTYSYLPDIDKANYFATRIEACALRTFSFMVMPNDHTRGRDPGAQTPRSMIADNDEGVGRVIEALSHSTYWPETVVFVFEDDPQDGGDHVDNHRTALTVISPWARRHHVSRTHVSEASVWRTLQLILGLADQPHSLEWEEAAPLYDFFTSTPDYTPYDLVPRRWPRETNPDDRSADALLSADYDWSVPDEQPGLSRLLWRHFHGAEPPWREPLPSPFEGDEEEE